MVQVRRERSSEPMAATYWRICAGNGRVLGRSASQFADEAAALVHCESVCDRADRLNLTVEHAVAGSGWSWRLDDPTGDESNRTVCFSARTFDRQASCRRAGKRMVQALSTLRDK